MQKNLESSKNASSNNVCIFITDDWVIFFFFLNTISLLAIIALHRFLLFSFFLIPVN